MVTHSHFIDVHCHLEGCGDDIDAVVSRAHEAGVGTMVTQGVDMATNKGALALSKKYPQVKAALGLYPINALALKDSEVKEVLHFIEKNADNCVALGEVGMDFKETEDRTKQREIFKQIITLAIKLDKPLIVHSRKAERECIELLEEMKAKKVIMHCFCGKFSLVERIAKNGWSLSVPTNVVHSEQFQIMASKIGIESLFSETDSPYLHPQKLRNNEPALVVESYKKIAAVRNEDVETIKKAFFANYRRVFGEKI